MDPEVPRINRLASAPAPPFVEGPTAKVLVAEDDPSTRAALAAALSAWGYSAVAVADGAQAWEALRADDPPRLALLNWLMPGLDGLEVCRRVREHHPDAANAPPPRGLLRRIGAWLPAPRAGHTPATPSSPAPGPDSGPR
jgi:CheY-like chemotaxis protein